jgi:NADH-ubiquinone oxidoreductase chain 4
MLTSLPLLVAILFIILWGYLHLLCVNSSLVSGLFYVSMVFAFLVRIPMFMVRLLLPTSHAEASVSGSIIAAGELLMLGRLWFSSCLSDILTLIFPAMQPSAGYGLLVHDVS